MHSSLPNPVPGRSNAEEGALEATIIRSFDNPLAVAWDRERSHSSEIYGFDSLDPRSRSFNLIRGKLLELKRQRNWRLIGVVSATPNVGKSFVAANISASLSRSPRARTFAVDLDLRRGSLTGQFAIPLEHGLSDFLAAGIPLDTFQPEGEQLTVVPTRGGMVHSAELLASDRAQSFFQAMRRSDDRNLFICDLPPVFANDDAVAAMAHLESYILVSEEGHTTEREIRDSVEALGRERLAGVILNKFRGGMVSDGYGVESYYAYGYESSSEDAS